MKNESILDLVGSTPLIKLQKLSPKLSVEIHAKLEGFNPSGSIKDRICKSMLEMAELKGELTKEKTILEPTSGNTGISLAMIAAAKGYSTLFIQPASVSVERALVLKAYGSDLILTPPAGGMDNAIRKAKELSSKNPEKYWMPNQFDNPANPQAHLTTGQEIWKQSDGKVTHFVAGMGTTGTIMGVGKFLKEKEASIKIIGVEPELGHKVQGLKNMKEAITPKIYDESLLDQKITVTTKDSYIWASKITREEGIFVGQSSGAAALASCKVAKEIDEGFIVTVFPDFGFKYVTSKPYYSKEVIKKVKEARKKEKTVQI